MKEYLNEKVNDEVLLRQHYEQKVQEMKMERNEFMQRTLNNNYEHCDNEEELNTENFELEEDECLQRRRKRHGNEKEKNGKQKGTKYEYENEQSDYNNNNILLTKTKMSIIVNIEMITNNNQRKMKRKKNVKMKKNIVITKI